MKALKSKEVKAVLKRINEQYNINIELDYYFFMNNRNRLYIINKDYNNINENELNIRNHGLYFGEYKNNEMRLSIEAAQLIYNKYQPTKNVLELQDAEPWLKGNDIEINKEDTGFLIIKYKDDILGSGKIKNNKLLNFTPKIRRLKTLFKV